MALSALAGNHEWPEGVSKDAFERSFASRAVTPRRLHLRRVLNRIEKDNSRVRENAINLKKMFLVIAEDDDSARARPASTVQTPSESNRTRHSPGLSPSLQPLAGSRVSAMRLKVLNLAFNDGFKGCR